ncbi:hypothetical protein [Roseateles sp. P5_D6]
MFMLRSPRAESGNVPFCACIAGLSTATGGGRARHILYLHDELLAGKRARTMPGKT